MAKKQTKYPSIYEQVQASLAKQRQEGIDKGLIVDDTKIKELAGKGPAEFAGTSRHSESSSKNSNEIINQQNKNIVKEHTPNPKVLSTIKSKGSGEFQGISRHYTERPEGFYEKYEGYIDPSILRSSDISTTELDKMLERNKRLENEHYIKVGVVIIVSIIIIILLYKKIKIVK